MRHVVRLCVVCVFGVLIVGCATIYLPRSAGFRNLTATYTSALVQIDRPDATRERYGQVVTIRPEPENKYFYEDGLFSGIFYVTQSRINFALTNKTDHSIKIVWDEAAFIDLDGQSGRVAHEGVKYGDRNTSQPPSVIPAHGTLTDFVLPTDRVYYREGYYGQYYSNPGGWEELGLVLPGLSHVPVSDSTAVETFQAEVQKNTGKRFGLLLPLEIEGIVNEYTFWFEVQNSSVATGSGL